MMTERYESGNVTVVRCTGDMDEEGSNALRLALNGCLQDQRRCVVVNLEKVNYTSYLGIGLLVERLRQFRACRGDLKLSNVNLYTQRLMRMASVLRLFQMCESEAQAIESFRKAA